MFDRCYDAILTEGLGVHDAQPALSAKANVAGGRHAVLATTFSCGSVPASRMCFAFLGGAGQ